MVQQLFDTSWEALSRESVERFLAGAGEEGLTWEAKGRKTPHRDSVRKAVCGFANAVGGYLIIGAERGQEGWRLPGAEFPSDEPGTWIGSLVAAGGVSPVPVFEPKAFDANDGRHAVVVRVEPVPTPPCITASGIAYQRVSGQTLPITDQRVLADLIQKGATLRAQTEALALRAAQRLRSEPMAFHAAASVFAMALCAVGGPENKSKVLFDRPRAVAFHQLVQQDLQADAMVDYGVQSSIHQDCLLAWTASAEVGQGTTAAAFWDGAVAVVYSDVGREYLVPTFAHDVRRFWRALVCAVELFGGVGDAHLAIVLNRDHPALRAERTTVPRTDIRRWTEAREPTAEELDSVVRELERGFGRASWEPGSSSS